jgi:hypothetical protein
MARFLLLDLIPSKTLLLAACAIATVYLPAPVATAQSVGGGVHPIRGAQTAPPHRSVPSTPRTSVSPPPAITPHLTVPSAHFGFRPGQNNLFRRRLFFRAPFFRFGPAFSPGFFWSQNCSPDWAWGYYCNGLPFYGYGSGFENYVTLQTYQAPVYIPGDRELVWLFLKDGTAYAVRDYWFVNDLVHFIAVDEAGAKSIEQTMPISDLDAEKTIDINEHRGFRVVMRDASIDQYMRDHPDLVPPLLKSPPKN